jgi:hypothetical protein
MLCKGSFKGNEKGILRTLFLVAGITKGAGNPGSTSPRTHRRYKYIFLKSLLVLISSSSSLCKPFRGFRGYKKLKTKVKVKCFFKAPSISLTY